MRKISFLPLLSGKKVNSDNNSPSGTILPSLTPIFVFVDLEYVVHSDELNGMEENSCGLFEGDGVSSRGDGDDVISVTGEGKGLSLLTQDTIRIGVIAISNKPGSSLDMALSFISDRCALCVGGLTV